MIPDEEQIMAIMVNIDGNEGTVRAHDDTGKLGMKVNIEPTH